MARNYRMTSTNNLRTVTGSGSLLFKIEPLEAEQAPSGYLKKVKVSCVGVPESHSPNTGIFIYASTDATNPRQHIITGQSVYGAGTVWLDVRRRVIQDSDDTSRNDAEVCIWAETSDVGAFDFLIETWGRYLEIDVVT